MTIQAPDWFVTQYQQRAMNIYQQRGNKLRGMITPAGEIVNAEKARFFLAGTSVARKRTRGQRLIPSGAQRTHFDVPLVDWYSYDVCETYDLARMSIDERENVFESGATALGRATDIEVYAQMAAGVTAASSYAGATLDFHAGAFNAAQAMTVCAALQDDKVDWDGNVFCGLPSLQWNQLLANKVVNNSQYVGADNLPFMSSTDSRKWNGVNWFLYVEQTAGDIYPVPSGGQQDIFMWHKSAVGWGHNTDITTQEPVWDPKEQRWDIVSILRGAASPLQLNKGIKRFTTASTGSIAIV